MASTVFWINVGTAPENLARTEDSSIEAKNEVIAFKAATLIYELLSDKY